jgi:hypothetical protein
VLKAGSAGAPAALLTMLDGIAWKPLRPAIAQTALPDIQFDIANFIAPATAVDGVQVQFGPVHTTFLTANLKSMPTKDQQTVFANALDTIESVYEFSPAGVFVFVSYGMGYFGRLPGALNGGSVSANNIPRLNFNNNRFALEEAKPSPTDAGQAGIVKRKFDITPQIGGIDVLFTIRSDSAAIIKDVIKVDQGQQHHAGRPVDPGAAAAAEVDGHQGDVLAARVAEGGGRERRALLRRPDQRPVADVDGVRRPADLQHRPGGGGHLRR